jgi:cytochrome c oxidase assembly protein subunit 15
MSERSQPSSFVRAWLWTCFALVALMVAVGGATRLTGSGLSITEWQPITGALPPLTQAAWDEFFAAYQASPQYQLENVHFELQDFKAIFWWEWSHRVLGRVIGLTVLLPLVFFWWRGALTPSLKRRGIIAFLLVVFQGALGWFMVASGLVDVPRVSHFRLAAHLLTALLTLVVLLWTALDVGRGDSHPARTRDGRAVAWFFVLVGAQIAWGAFVAGLRAGLYYPTWPRMGTRWVPEDMWGGLHPMQAIIDHPVAVQWVHRWLGAVVLVVGLTVLTRAAKKPALRTPAIATALALAGQFTLGVFTVLNFYRQPVLYGVSHQAGAVVLLIALTVLLYRAGRAPGP